MHWSNDDFRQHIMEMLRRGMIKVKREDLRKVPEEKFKTYLTFGEVYAKAASSSQDNS